VVATLAIGPRADRPAGRLARLQNHSSDCGAGVAHPVGSAVVPFSPSPASPSNMFDGGGTNSPDINTVGCGIVAEGFPVLSGLSSVPGSGAVTSSAVTSLGGGNNCFRRPNSLFFTFNRFARARDGL
jgi:hypothetical protein